MRQPLGDAMDHLLASRAYVDVAEAKPGRQQGHDTGSRLWRIG